MKTPSIPGRSERGRAPLPAAACGGLLAGFFVAAIPYIVPNLSIEVQHVRAHIVEIVFFAGRRFMTPGLSRAANSPAGTAAILATMGAAFGLAAGLVARRRSAARGLPAGFAGAAAAFVALAAVAEVRTLLFYPSRAILSLKGAAWIAAASAVAIAVGLILVVALRKARIVGTAVLAAAAVFCAARMIVPPASRPSPEPGPIRRVVLIGVTGLSWNVLTPMIRAGRLPVLGRLVAEGSSGYLRPSLPIGSPTLWATLATGRREAGHGIRGFHYLDPGSGRIRPVSISFRKAAALWDIAAATGRTSAVVNWLGGWPAEATRGVFVSSRVGARGEPARVVPDDRLAEMESMAGTAVDMDPASVGRVTVRALGGAPPDLALAGFITTDRILHRKWAASAGIRGGLLERLVPPRGAAAPPADGRFLEDEIAGVDRAVGDIISAAGPGTAVIVVSDHGFGPARGPVTFEVVPLLKALGWYEETPDGGVDWARARVFDRTPEDPPRSLPREWVLNLRPEGPFAMGAAGMTREAFVARAAETLRSLRTSSGRKLARRVRVVRDAKTGSDELLVWLDVRPDPGERVAIGGREYEVADLLKPGRAHSGMHRLAGMIIARGPGIRAGTRIVDATVEDVAPTVLRWLGIPGAGDFEGRALDEIMEADWIRGHPAPPPVATYGGPKGVRVPGARAAGAGERILETLRSLGYAR